MGTKYCLVYQAGIANIFKVKCFNLANFGRDAKRILQADFRTCENFALGLVEASCIVKSCHCNKAGDIQEMKWSENLEEAPFYENMHPVDSDIIRRSK